MRKFNEWLLIRESEGGEEEVVIMQHALDQIGKILDDYDQKVSAHVGGMTGELDDIRGKHSALDADHQKLKSIYEKPPAPAPTPAPAGPGLGRRLAAGVADKLGSTLDTKDPSKGSGFKAYEPTAGVRDALGGWLKKAASKLRQQQPVDMEAVDAAILGHMLSELAVIRENNELQMATSQMRAQIMAVLKSALTAMYNSAQTLHKYKPPGVSSLGAPSSQARAYHAWLMQKQANPEFADPEPIKRGAKGVKAKVEKFLASQQKPGPDSLKGRWE